MYIPLISSFPAATPGPHKTTGYAYVRAPCAPFAADWPMIGDEPALRSAESAFTVFYPSNAPATGAVSWLPPPLDSMVAGYAKFLGGKGSWICKSCLTMDQEADAQCRAPRRGSSRAALV